MVVFPRAPKKLTLPASRAGAVKKKDVKLLPAPPGIRVLSSVTLVKLMIGTARAGTAATAITAAIATDAAFHLEKYWTVPPILGFRVLSALIDANRVPIVNCYHLQMVIELPPIMIVKVCDTNHRGCDALTPP
jgi:hypothetical protein